MGDHLGVHALGQVIDPIRIQGREPVDGFPPLFRVMTPTVVGKMGKVFTPPEFGPEFGTRFIPTRVGKLLGLWPVKVTVLMVAHPCLGWGCLAAKGLVGCRFSGAVPGRPPNPRRPGNPCRSPCGGKGKRCGFGWLGCSQARGVSSWPRNNNPLDRQRLV